MKEEEEEQQEARSEERSEECRCADGRRGRIWERRFLSPEMEIIITLPSSTYGYFGCIERASGWRDEAKKRKNFTTYLSCLPPCLAWMSMKKLKWWIFCEKERFSVSCPTFLLDSWVHIRFVHTHARQSKASRALFLDGSCCIPCLFVFLSSYLFAFLIFTCIFPPTQLKALGWGKHWCHWWRFFIF